MMWTQVKKISKEHPNPVIRKYAKHLMAKMNAGKKHECRKEILFFIKNHSNAEVHR